MGQSRVAQGVGGLSESGNTTTASTSMASELDSGESVLFSDLAFSLSSFLRFFANSF